MNKYIWLVILEPTEKHPKGLAASYGCHKLAKNFIRDTGLPKGVFTLRRVLKRKLNREKNDERG